MPHYPYLIVGGGMAADAAARGLLEVDPQAEIGLLSAESDPPYNRPPLSKGLWKGQALQDIWRDTGNLGVRLHLNARATALDLARKQVTDEAGTVYGYDKLLLATGGRARPLPSGGEHVLGFRTLADYQRLRDLAAAKRRFVVIGGGFIGSELAAALAVAGREVSMVFPEPGIGARTFPVELSGFLNGYYQERGVKVLAGETVASVTPEGQGYLVTTGSGTKIPADAVVAGLGIELNTELARAAGLEVDNGIVTDEYLRAGRPDVYAAGDVANFYNPALGRRLRVEHEDNANSMGAAAGRNMAGAHEPYHHLPFFYSDLFELGYEAVGVLDARLQTVTDWQEPCRKGVVYYLEDGRVRGVLLWDTWGKVDEARELIAAAGPLAAADLRGRIS